MENSGVRYSYILLFILCNCWGCTHTVSTMLPQEMETARELFLQKNYREAATTFSKIQQQTKSKSLQQTALLGQTCSEMLVDGNNLQPQEVLQLWQSWCDRREKISHSEEFCTFLTPVVESYSHLKKNSVKISQQKKSLNQRLNPKQGDLTKILAKQEKELKKLRNQIKKRDQNIEELHTKLKALEDINQEIEQKKKGMDLQ